MRRWHHLIGIAAITIFVCIAIAINLSPYLRGPAPYYPDWRWLYEPANTLNKLWAPLVCILGIIYIAYRTERQPTDMRRRNTFFLLSTLILIGFLFQISLLFYSQAGLNVIMHRITNPGISGYFTTALRIRSFPLFLDQFNAHLGDYPMYAKFHPPAADLIFLPILSLCHMFASQLTFLNHLQPNHADFAKTWNTLQAYQKAAALVSGITITFLSTLAIIPLYFSSKLLYGPHVAIRSVLLFLFVPSLLLFTPLNDVFFPLLTLSFLYCFLYGLYRMSPLVMLLAGVIFCMSMYFSLTFLPFLLFLFLLSIFSVLYKKASLLQGAQLFLLFLIGACSLPLGLFLIFGFNSIEMTQKIMLYHYAAEGARHYSTWLFYDVYDFLLFLGVPLALLYGRMLYTNIRTAFPFSLSKYLKRTDSFFLAFTIIFLFLDLSGSVKGETARVWLPYVPLLLIILANYVTKIWVLTRWQLLLVLVLQAIQVLVFQSVLVTLS